MRLQRSIQTAKKIVTQHLLQKLEKCFEKSCGSERRGLMLKAILSNTEWKITFKKRKTSALLVFTYREGILCVFNMEWRYAKRDGMEICKARWYGVTCAMKGSSAPLRPESRSKGSSSVQRPSPVAANFEVNRNRNYCKGQVDCSRNHCNR